MALNIGSLLPLVLTIVVVGLLIVYTADITQDIQDDISSNTSGSYNATVNMLDASENISSKLGTIGQIGVVVVIIGLLIGGFAMKSGRL